MYIVRKHSDGRSYVCCYGLRGGGCQHWSYVINSVVVLTDVEVEGVSAGASIIVCIIVSVCATLRIVDFMPCVLFASILVIGVEGAVIDC